MGLAAFIAALGVLIGRSLADDCDSDIGMCFGEVVDDDAHGATR